MTISIQNRICLFGQVIDGVMHLNDAGQMIMKWWAELPNKFPNVEIDTSIVMPNHFHGIVVVHGESDRTTHRSSPTDALPDIMQWFKTMTTNAYIKGVKQNGWESFPGQVWQRGYHDHIIRDDQDMTIRQQYIFDNPARWQNDENYLP
ncbi:MAG: transposase [Anaerolineae bacterium]